MQASSLSQLDPILRWQKESASENLRDQGESYDIPLCRGKVFKEYFVSNDQGELPAEVKDDQLERGLGDLTR